MHKYKWLILYSLGLLIANPLLQVTKGRKLTVSPQSAQYRETLNPTDFTTNTLPNWRKVGGLNIVPISQEPLTGKGVSVGVVELSQEVANNPSVNAFLPDFFHKAFKNIKLNCIYYYHNPHMVLHVSEHAEIIAGILFGKDHKASWDKWCNFSYQGILPEAKVDWYEANWFIYKELLAAKPKHIADDVINISWGTVADDVVTMWWQRAMDNLVEKQGVIIVAACGNGEDELNSITKPSWGYNIISVGAAQNLGKLPERLQYIGPPVMEYSSFGPTSDGRAKPDIIAPGLCLYPKGKSEYTTNDNGTGYSSFAAPQAAGLAGILIEAARRNNMTSATDPRVIKALILNGANKLIGWHKGSISKADDHEVPLDFCQGAGLINGWNSYQQLIAGRYNVYRPENTAWDLNWLSTNPDSSDTQDAQRVYYLPQPLQKGIAFKATLCWYRHYKNNRLFTPKKLVHLELSLWAVDKKGQLIKRLDYSDSRSDNVQHIYYMPQNSQKVALLVRIAPNKTNKNNCKEARVREIYGLAFCDDQVNWSGDQMKADLNADGIVDIKDLIQFVHVWKQYEDNPEMYNNADEIIALPEDFNGDGIVDIKDFNIFSNQWHKKSVWKR